MMDFDHEIDPVWQARVLNWMSRVALLKAEPSEVVQSWLDEASDGNQRYLVWAIAQWLDMSTMGVWELERIGLEARNWLHAHDKSVSS